MHRDPDQPPVCANETFLDRVKLELSRDLLAEGLPIRIDVIGMRVRENPAGEQVFSAEAGDRSNRLIDATEVSVGVNLGNSNGGVLVGCSKTLLLLARMRARFFQRLIHTLALGNVEKTIYGADNRAFFVKQRINVDR